MHFKSLLHVRDHAKVRGTAHHLLEYIAMHTNMHTAEAFELTVERLAHRLDVTPQWVGQLKARLVQAGELLVKQSRGRHPNVYVIPYERCPACQGINPKLGYGDEINPKVRSLQPQSQTHSTPKSDPSNPKVAERSNARHTGIEPPKEFKEKRERTEDATPKFDGQGNKPERRNPFWCDAHGFVHSARLPDHHPDCWLELSRDPNDMPPPRMRLVPHAEAGLPPIALVLNQTLKPEGTP